MMSASTPLILDTVCKYLQQGLQRCMPIYSDSASQRETDFHAYLASHAQQPCHRAMEMQEVLQQVFKHLDSGTLCSSIPLVCRQWRAAAACEQLWTARCDTQLLDVVRKPCVPGSATSSPVTGVTSSAGDVSSTSGTAGASTTEGIRQPPPSRQFTVQLPRLYHAVYARNLLRNPMFMAAANGEHGSGVPAALLTLEQRRVAWVKTAGDTPSWEQLPASTGKQGLQPPLPLRYPGALSNSSSSGSRLQEWLFGPSWGSAASASGSTHGAAAAGAVVAGHQLGRSTSCLATGSDWSEVVQVVDLASELVSRGLDLSTAHAALDQADLAIAFSFWVSAAPNPQRTPAPLSPGPSTQSCTSADQHQSVGVHTGASSSMASNDHTTVAAAAKSSGPATPGTTAGLTRGSAAAGPPALFAAALVLDDGVMPLRSFQTFVCSDSTHHFFSRRLELAPEEGWRRYAYVVRCCPKGVRRAVVLLRGRGNGSLPRPGAGAAATRLHTARRSDAAGSRGTIASGSGGAGGGVRFACAQLCFIKQDEIEAFGAEEALATWQERTVLGP